MSAYRQTNGPAQSVTDFFSSRIDKTDSDGAVDDYGEPFTGYLYAARFLTSLKRKDQRTRAGLLRSRQLTVWAVCAESALIRLLSTVIPNYLVSNFSLIRAALPESSRK
jgi:hypothetical protein